MKGSSTSAGESAAIVLLQEIAEALAVEKRTVERRATKGRPKNGEAPWSAHWETVRGGRRKCFYLSELPADVQEAVRKKRKADAAKQLLEQTAAQDMEAELAGYQRSGEQLAEALLEKRDQEARARRKRKEEGLRNFGALSKDSDKYKRAKAREWLVLRVHQYKGDHKAGALESREAVAEAVNANTFAIPEHVIDWIPCRYGVRQLTSKTLENWTLTYEKGGIWALTDGYGKRRGQSKIVADPKLYSLVLGCLARHPHIKAPDLWEYLNAVHGYLTIPGTRSIQRFMKDWKEENAQLWTFMTNPDQWKNIYMAAAGSHFEEIHALNQLWEMDSTPGDWLLKDGRHSVIGVIDLWSRRLKLYVSKTSKAIAVCQLFRRAVLDWGVPEGVRTDNGKDYVSEQFSGVLRDLEVIQEVCIPFASEEKGTIERALQTMSHSILDLLPGFIGHSVADRKKIEARKSFAQRIMHQGEAVEVEMTSDELQQVLDQWVDHMYSHKPHAGLGKQTPFKRYSSWDGSERRIEDERALDMLLAEVAGTRTITKKGIRFNHYNYFNDSLFAFAGREALLKYDEQDLGQLYAYVDGEFVGALTCHELQGISRKEAATAAKRKQKQLLSEQSREYKALTKEVHQNIPQAVLEQRIEQSDKLAAFPKRSETHASRGLTEAANAARSAAGTKSIPEQDETLVAAARKALTEAPIADKPKATVTSLGTPAQKYQRWLELDRKVSAGEAITDERLLRFYKHYTKNPEFEVQRELEEMRQAIQARSAK